MNRRKRTNRWIAMLMVVVMTLLSLQPQMEGKQYVKAAEKVLILTEGSSYIITSKQSNKVMEVLILESTMEIACNSGSTVRKKVSNGRFK